MSRRFAVYLVLLALLMLAGGAALAQPPQPAEARLDKYPAELRLDKGEARCGDYFIFHDGTANNSNVDKVSYFYFEGSTSKYAMPALGKVEVAVADRAVPTVQQTIEDGVVKKVVLHISQADLDKAACLKKQVEKTK